MIRWIPYTFVRTVIFFISGILLGIYCPDIVPELYARVSLLVMGSAYILSYFLISRKYVNPGFIAIPAIVLSGYVHILAQTESRRVTHFMHETSPIEYYKVVITKYPQEKDRSWKIEGQVLTIKSTSWKDVEGKVVVYLSKNDFNKPFQYGDILLVKGTPKALQPPVNPGEFDYKRFLTFRNIYHQHFLRKDDVWYLENDSSFSFMKYAIVARVWADDVLKKNVGGEREQAIASALVLGVTDGLDNELLNAYAATGAMHVLAVSGLHISIIYLIILWILKPLTKFRSGQWLLAAVSLTILWTYAFITGLSPSVLRAVTMFSLMAVARAWSKNTNIYNTLAASAFLLLLYDPYMVMSVGFQLSYLAVLGIVYLQPKLCQLWEPNNRFNNEVWKITCVAIAAQLATFSLGLLYFHQFPNYFLLSNLLVIPISFGVLVLGLVVLATSVVNIIASASGFLLMILIKVLNFIVFTVESFPFSLMDDIYITTAQCWLLMVLIVTFIVMLQHKRFKYLIIASCVVVVYAITQWKYFFDDVHIKKMTVYSIAGHTAIDFIDRGHCYFLVDSVLGSHVNKIRFHIRPNRLKAGVNKVYSEPQIPFVKHVNGGRFLRWQSKTILIIDSKTFTLPEAIAVDMIIIRNNAVKDLNELASFQIKDNIIIDSSNSFYRATHLVAQASQRLVPVYSVLHRGAFDLTFQF
jgi:competence protein ComEC